MNLSSSVKSIIVTLYSLKDNGEKIAFTQCRSKSERNRDFMKIERHFGLRIEDELLRKFRYVCEYDGRSANGKILHMIRNCVAEYEKEHGEIKLDSGKKND